MTFETYEFSVSLHYLIFRTMKEREMKRASDMVKEKQRYLMATCTLEVITMVNDTDW